MKKYLAEKIKLIPENPGCYIYKNSNNDVIYVGKAKNLKNRIKSYFVGAQNKKTQILVSNIYDFEYIIVNSEKEALILENNLIKQYKPYYNIKLKDDKSYPYLVITNEENPRIILSRKYSNNNKNIYFGPYVDIKSATKIKNIIDKIYPLRKCNPVDKRPCMYYQIGECIGPCAKKISKKQYDEQINKIKSFLNGNIKDVINKLEQKREKYILNLEFEQAGIIHQFIEAINISISNQIINDNINIDRDYIGYYYEGNYLCVQMFLYRFGGIIERKVEYFNLYVDYKETLYSYLVQYYSINKLPKEIYITNIDTELIGNLLNVKIIEPKIGKNKKIIDTLINNSKHYLKNELIIKQEKENEILKTLENLSKKIGIKSIFNIDAFDNSNIMGRDAVSVKVNFYNGEKNTYKYKKFKVNTVDGINDIETTKEVLYRNYKNYDYIPDLIIVDGGENHVSAAIEIIHNKLNLNIKIIGLAKNDKHKTEYIVTDDFEIIKLDKSSKEYLFLKNIQDEVHRFAITYHRNIKTKNMFNNKLDTIKGIGMRRKKILLENFSSFDDIKNADTNMLVKLGIPLNIVYELKEKL